jgi:NAD(P)-dependent dehydrogenase (short-subunit alcohol dehydrogenase family)
MLGKYNFDFSGKCIVLTGAAGGLGAPVARGFASAGADLAICDYNEQNLQKLEKEIKKIRKDIFFKKVNLLVKEEVESFADSVVDKFGKIDVLVNLAGGIIRKASSEYELSEWERVMDINLKICWLCCQTVGKIMLKQKDGRIINYSSGAGLYGIPGYPAYSPAKAGVMALTRVLAVEWGPMGISTNAIAPGFIDTPINAEVISDKARLEKIMTRMPMGSILPDNAIVGPTLFLSSEASKWINGHTLVVDSGFIVS